MMTLQQLADLLDGELQPDQFEDYCPNGLQVEGKDTVQKLATGVTASLAFIEKAIDWGADALLVHHGYFWRGERANIVGIKKQRLQTLLNHNVSLFAYHLPLDAHPVLGNNQQLALSLGIAPEGPLEPNRTRSLGLLGRLPAPMSLAAFGRMTQQVLGREPLLICAGDHPISRIGWCTGAAQSYIDRAAAQGVDAFLSGEISESTVHFARESGVHYIAAGHHATERGGVQALGQWLTEQHDVEHRFFDIANPA